METESQPRSSAADDAFRWRLALGVTLLLGALTLLPTLTAWETMWDNIMSHLHARLGRSMHEIGTYQFNETNGRIPAYFMSIADSLPWRLGKTGHQAVKIFFLGAHVLAFGWLIHRLSGDRWLGLLAGGGFLIVLQNHTNFDVVNCFVVSMHLPAIALYLAIPPLIRFFVARRDGGSSLPWLLLSALLLLVSLLFYEMFILFAPLLPILAWLCWHRTRADEVEPGATSAPHPLAWMRACVVPWVVLGIVCIAYTGVYAYLASTVESEYKGSTIEKLELSAATALFTDYTLSGLPASHLLRSEKAINAEIVADAQTVRGEFGANAQTLGATLLDTGAFARMVLAGTLAWFALGRLGPIEYRRRWALGILALALILLPNVLVALTAGHQRYHQELGYLAHNTTWFCALGWWLAICLLLSAAANWIPCRPVALLGTLGIAALSILTDSWNTNAHVLERNFSSKWRNMEAFMESDLFVELPEDAVLLAPSLHTPRSYWEGDLYGFHEFWSYFAEGSVHPKVRFLRTPEEFAELYEERQGTRCYYLKYSEAENLHRQFLALGPIQSFDHLGEYAEVGVSELEVLHFSPTQEATFRARWLGEPGQVELRGAELARQPAGSGSFAGIVRDRFEPGSPYTRFGLRSLAEIDPQSFTLGYYVEPEQAGAIDPALSGKPIWSRQFWEEEPIESGRGRSSWSGDRATLKIFLPGSEPRDARVSFMMLTKAALLGEDTGEVGARFGEFEGKGPSGFAVEEEAWPLRPGINTLVFTTTAASKQIEGDLWHNFAVLDFRLEW